MDTRNPYVSVTLPRHLSGGKAIHANLFNPRLRRTSLTLAIGAATVWTSACSRHRSLQVDALEAPLGLAVCYGPFREGQAPDGEQPSRDHIRTDLLLLSRDFNTLRTYSSLGPTRDLLEVTRDEEVSLRVLLGVWIAPETHRGDGDQPTAVLDDNAQANAREMDAAIELASEFPDLVAAIIVGNETQVSWSAHRVHRETLISYLRLARRSTSTPVTTADDFSFWLDPASDAVAREIDFIVTHAYAMWNGMRLDEAIAFTDEKVLAVREAHPEHTVVLGETGWATQKHTEGDQGRLIKGIPGAEQQAVFLRDIRRWAARTRTITFFFEAFDEPWKGGDHPDEVEKHWGLYTVQRVPKEALRDAHAHAPSE